MSVATALVSLVAALSAHHDKPAPQTALASWYDDSGTTASGGHYQYGFASLMFGSDWGHRIRFCYRGCVVGRLDDHGPYVPGRAFDLNPSLKAALGCPDLCWLHWNAVVPVRARVTNGAKLVIQPQML
jgi:hypothetical protein